MNLIADQNIQRVTAEMTDGRIDVMTAEIIDVAVDVMIGEMTEGTVETTDATEEIAAFFGLGFSEGGATLVAPLHMSQVF